MSSNYEYDFLKGLQFSGTIDDMRKAYYGGTGKYKPVVASSSGSVPAEMKVGDYRIKSPYGSIATWFLGGRLEFDFDNTVPNTWQIIKAIPARPFAVRAIFAQGLNLAGTTATPSAIARVTMLSAPTLTAADAADWSTSLKKAGNLSIALAKGAAYQRRGFSVSDWVGVDAPDLDASGYCYVAMRAWVNGGNPLTLSGNTAGTEDYSGWMTHADGRVMLIHRRPGDFASTNQANFSASATRVNDCPIVGFQYMTTAGIITVGSLGDSTDTGVTGSRYRCEGWAGRAVFGLSTPEFPLEFMQLAWPTHAAATYRSHISDAIAAGLIPDVLTFPCASPNEITTTIAASDISKSAGYFGEIMAACFANKIRPVVKSWMPSTNAVKAYGATDSLRVAYNAKIEKEFRVPIVPASTLVSGAAHASGQIEPAPGLMDDGIHPNATAEALILPYAKTAIAKALIG